MVPATTVGLLLVWLVCVWAVPARHPHLIFALADDLGWFGTSVNGNHEVHTPSLDELAREGVVLDNYYVYKFCSPSRASFLTGRVPGHGIWEANPPKTSAIATNMNMTMLPAMLKKAGYATHQGFYCPQATPHGRGFDTSLGFLWGGEDHFTQCSACANGIPDPDYSEHPIPCPAQYSPCNVRCPEEGGVDFYQTDHPLVGKNGTYNSYTYSTEVVRIVNEHPSVDTPLFIFLAMHDTHQPVEAPPEFVDPYPASQYNATTIPRRIYNAMTTAVDQIVGNLTAALKAKGMWENTVMVFSTDNGGTFEHAGIVPGVSNYPLRGFKYSFFEGGIRGTGVVTSPLLPKDVAGKRSSAMIQMCDWYPTFLTLASVDPDDGFHTAPVDGIDAWPLLTGASTKRPAANWEGGTAEDEMIYGVGHGTVGSLRQGDMKLVVGGQLAHCDGWSAQFPGSTTAVPPPAKEACVDAPCLFNLDSDRSEQNDLSQKLPHMTAAMLKRYKELAARMDVPNGHEEALREWIDGGGEKPEGPACANMKKTGFAPFPQFVFLSSVIVAGYWAPWQTFP